MTSSTITVCTVVQNCRKGRSNKYGKINDTFGGAAAEKLFNRLTQNLAWVIMSGTPLNIPSGMSIGLGGLPRRISGEMLMVCAFYFVCSLAQLGVKALGRL